MHISSIERLCGKHYTNEQLNAWTSVLTPSVYDQALKEKVFLIAHDSKQDLLGLGILDIQNAESLIWYQANFFSDLSPLFQEAGRIFRKTGYL